jgi:RimJ/RimL family protein N-acetyltransferase
LSARVRLVSYSREYLERSWEWLNDPEVKRLTLTPDFTQLDQISFFEALPARSDYRVWGLELEGDGPIGAAGIKNISSGTGEYWGYIGEKQHWGQGLGRSILGLVEAEAAALGINELDLRVAPYNLRAISLYEKCGYVACGERDGTLRMNKQIGA